jgi:galactokinase
MIGTDTNKVVDGFVSACDRVWAEQTLASGPRHITKAPARLDVMGGIADYTGSLVLQWALPLEARVAIAPRNDQKVSITSIGWSNDGDSAQSVWPLSALYAPAGKLASPEAFSAHFHASGCPWARHVAGVFYTLLEAGAVPHYAGGASLVIQSDIPHDAGIGSSAAIAVATGLALAALTGKSIAPIELARLCHRAENFVVGNPRGISDKVVALMAGAGSLLQMRCQPHELLGHMRLCPGTTIIGIDSRVHGDKRLIKFTETRVASFMGLRIIETILRNGQSAHGLTGGYLANITPTDYVERFRDLLPTKMRGRDFLERYGHIDDAATRVDPDTIYKVRSRTEHHIYENDRVHRFAERFSRATRTGERDALIEAGELMYASHWSYSQRCGMGSIETDILVNLLRAHGPTKGIYGAKVTSAGCGGTLAALIADTPAAHEAIEDACRAYAEKTAREPRLFRGSANGGASEPARRLD